MSDQTVPVVPTETPEVPEKKKFHLNRKMVGGFAAGILATVGTAFAITKLSKSSDSSDPEVPTEDFESYVDPTDPTT